MAKRGNGGPSLYTPPAKLHPVSTAAHNAFFEEARISKYEKLGATRSDAQGIVEAQDMQKLKICEKCFLPIDAQSLRCNCKESTATHTVSRLCSAKDCKNLYQSDDTLPDDQFSLCPECLAQIGTRCDLCKQYKKSMHPMNPSICEECVNNLPF